MQPVPDTVNDPPGATGEPVTVSCRSAWAPAGGASEQSSAAATAATTKVLEVRIFLSPVTRLPRPPHGTQETTRAGRSRAHSRARSPAPAQILLRVAQARDRVLVGLRQLLELRLQAPVRLPSPLERGLRVAHPVQRSGDPLLRGRSPCRCGCPFVGCPLGGSALVGSALGGSPLVGGRIRGRRLARRRERGR